MPYSGVWDPKDPSDNTVLSIDFKGALHGEAVSSSPAPVWTQVPAGALTIVQESQSGTIAMIRVSGGAAGTVVELSCLATSTPSGYKAERTGRLEIDHR